MQRSILKKILFIILAILCAVPYVKPPVALIGGFLFSCFLGNPFPKLNGKLTGLLLKICIIGLGFGINVNQALQIGKQSFWLTFFTITLTLVAGYFIGKWLKIGKRPSYLISSGTAICGGSAIAAIAPIIKASEEEISTSLGVIFLLNSVALLLFPAIGHWFGLSQENFGLWSAIAIHDTSSVVGAAATYGTDALKTATTVKLARTLWIIPLCLLSLFLYKSENKKIKIPWFIIGFIAAIMLHSYVHLYQPLEAGIVSSAKSLLVVTLFFIGANLSLATLRAVGWRLLLLGISIWLLISISSLSAIIGFY